MVGFLPVRDRSLIAHEGMPNRQTCWCRDTRPQSPAAISNSPQPRRPFPKHGPQLLAAFGAVRSWLRCSLRVMTTLVALDLPCVSRSVRLAPGQNTCHCTLALAPAGRPSSRARAAVPLDTKEPQSRGLPKRGHHGRNDDRHDHPERQGQPRRQTPTPSCIAPTARCPG